MEKQYASLTRRTTSSKFSLESVLNTSFREIELSGGNKLINVSSREIAVKINPVIDNKINYDTISAKGVIKEYMFDKILSFQNMLRTNSWNDMATVARSEKKEHLGHTICYSKNDDGGSFNISFKMFKYNEINELTVELTVLDVDNDGKKDYTTFTSFINYALMDHNVGENDKSKLKNIKGLSCQLIDDLCRTITASAVTENLPFDRFAKTI